MLCVFIPAKLSACNVIHPFVHWLQTWFLILVLVQHFYYLLQKALRTKENVNKISIYFKLLWEILNYCTEKKFFLPTKNQATLNQCEELVSGCPLAYLPSRVSSQEPKEWGGGGAKCIPSRCSCLVSTKLKSTVELSTPHYYLKSQGYDRRNSSPGNVKDMSRKKRVGVELCRQVTWPSSTKDVVGYGLSPISPISVDTCP